MKTIIVGSNHANTAEYSKKLGLPTSELITRIDQSYEIGHTCIQDIPDQDILEKVLSMANQVYWAECDKSEFFDDLSYYDFLYWLQKYNFKFNNVKNISLIKLDPYHWKLDLPQLSFNDIVFLGSSTTAGDGLSDPETWYANLIGKNYQLPVVNLAEKFHLNGSIGNNDLIFDIFTQLEFNQKQMVVIQLAPLDRIRWCDEDAKLLDLQLSHNKTSYKRAMVEVFNRKYLLYKLLNQIRAIIKISRLQKLKLVIWIDNYKLDQEFQQEMLCFYEYPEIISKAHLSEYLVDFAEDNKHPGIKSNQILSDIIVQYLDKLYK